MLETIQDVVTWPLRWLNSDSHLRVWHVIGLILLAGADIEITLLERWTVPI